ncbi:methyltransferase domain-containing protein [Pseudomonas atagonensis]|uniref:methyltransferase domain-containing protein n=1 Tax=Pseudomonas atagonensis TaxID=2609964 RepID=UPI00140E7D95|nr:methyltransferase domain-containing protein [Pseudomonas atagonensis]
MSMRDSVRAGIPAPEASVLEIGPLYRPFFLKSETDVIYVDHADTDTLREKYRVGHGFDVKDIVEVDAVWGDNSLVKCAGRQVDYVIASHVIEHVPDLITWFKELQAVLNSDGQIRLVVPDKRYTFDFARRETALQDLIDPYARRTRRPLPANIFDHMTYVKKVAVAEAWDKPLDSKKLEPLHSYEMAMSLVEDALSSQNYHDVHCWVFTPYSFATLMLEAAEYGLLNLECVEFTDTPHYSLEFIVFVRPSSDVSVIKESWKKMQQSVRVAVDYPEIFSSLKSCVAPKGVFEGGSLSREIQLASALGECQEDLNILQQELAEAQDDLAKLKSELSMAKLKNTAYEHSRSWRLTAPLRAIQRKFSNR